MSTLISSLIVKGYREAGILGLNDTVTTAQQTEALDRLQSLYSSFFGNELGEQLTPMNYGNNAALNNFGMESDESLFIDTLYVPVNVRLMLNLGSAKTIYLDPRPMDGARLGVVDVAGNLATNNLTLNGNGRLVNGAATQVLNTNGNAQEWLFRGDLGNWVPITALATGSPSPLPQEFDDLLSTALAIRLNPSYGAQTSQEMNLILGRMKKNFRARYRQDMEQHSETGIIRLPSNRFWRYTNSNSAFNRGRLV